VIGAVNVLIAVTAIRLTLLVAVCGAFSLAYLTVGSANPYELGILGIYTALVVGPLVWLASRR
jgi:hypothetical protein